MPARDDSGELRANPYSIDPRSPWFHVLNVSGGRSSGYLLRQVLDAHGGSLPARCEAVFANTGRERAETRDFVAAMSDRWGVPITWLEFGHDPHGRGGAKYQARIVARATASMNGEPFDAMMRVEWVPSMTKRICTSELKVRTIDRHLWRRHGLTRRQTRKIIGFRFDEPARWRPAVYDACETVFPMVEAGVTKADVAAFWRGQPFDLQIPSERGNCDLCYLKSPRNLMATIRAEPWRADWWIAAEDRAGRTFRQRESFRELRAAALAPIGNGEIERPHSPDRGSVTAEIGEGLPCFCTD